MNKRSIVPPWRKLPKPTPLQAATEAYERAQFALLDAQSTAENANAEVRVYELRIARLKTTMRDLANDPIEVAR
jgi:hypothetical protein